jgi:hypothetical protein
MTTNKPSQPVGTDPNETDRRLSAALRDWFSQADAGPPVEDLPDDEVLALSYAHMDAGQSVEMDDLLARRQTGALKEAERRRLDELIDIYRACLVRRASALKEAVDRGLRPPLR